MLPFLIQRPIAVLMSFLGLLILGGTTMFLLPVSLLPDVPIPEISVQVNYPELSAADMELYVAQPLRNQLLQVGKLKDIESNSRNGKLTISLLFEFGTNTDLAFIEVNEKIDQVIGQLPREMPRPRVIKANVADVPVFALSLIPREESMSLELTTLARQVIKRRIEQLPEVAFVDISGWETAEVVISPDPAKMQMLQWTEQDIVAIIKANELELGNILLQDNQYQFNVRFPSGLQSVRAIQNLYLNQEGTLLQLKDIATVELRSSPNRGKYLYNGKPAIAFLVRKQADARLFELKRKFAALLADLRQSYPNLEFAVSNDQSEALQVSIDNLLSSLGYGAFFAFVILFLFFWEWRAPTLIGLAIPMALLLAMLGLYLTDISINTISLAGLILGIGLMIDNSIIVIENIRQYRGMGFELGQACVLGTNEVIRPLISSALTSCSVFVPLVFLSGIAGSLFFDQAISICIALGASLVVAYFFLPTVVRLLANQKSDESSVVKKAEKSLSIFTRSTNLILQNRSLILILLVAPTVLGAYLFIQLPKESFPALSRQGYVVQLDWIENISLLENERRVAKILLEMNSLLSTSQVFLGEQQFLLTKENQGINEAEIYLYTTEDQAIVKKKMRSLIQQTGGLAKVQLSPIKSLFDEVFGTVKPPLVIELRNESNAHIPSPESIVPLLDSLAQSSIAYEVTPTEKQYTISIIREEALRYGISYQQIYDRLKTLFNQNEITQLKMGEQFVPLQINSGEAGFLDLIQRTIISNGQGTSLPLANFLEVDQKERYKEVRASRGGPAYQLPIDSFSDPLIQDIKRWMAKDGTLSFAFSGQGFEDQQQLLELFWVFLMALLLLYLILAAQFESLFQPLIVLFTVPLSVVGSGLMLMIFKESLNIISLTGMVVMSGIIINDAILKVDMINRIRTKMTLREAIHEAGRRRIRPIIMTSLTTILALTPVLFSTGLGADLQRPLAYAVIGGLVVGTMASIWVIPALYSLGQELD